MLQLASDTQQILLLQEKLAKLKAFNVAKCRELSDIRIQTDLNSDDSALRSTEAELVRIIEENTLETHNLLRIMKQAASQQNSHLVPTSFPMDTAQSQETESSPDISILPTTCYSPKCTADRTCYAFSCPSRGEEETRLPFIAQDIDVKYSFTHEKEDGVSDISFLPKECYSPRCTPDRVCYSFLCPHRDQEKTSIISRDNSDFSILPGGCYSPRCTADRSCYAFSCPFKKMPGGPSVPDSEILVDIALEKQNGDSAQNLVSAERTPSRPWTPSYSVSTLNGPQDETSEKESENDAKVRFPHC